MTKDIKDYMKRFEFKFIFAWYDFWIGVFIDTKKKLIYFFQVPMFGIIFKYGYTIHQGSVITKGNFDTSLYY